MTSLTALSFQLRLGALCVLLGSSGCETPIAKLGALNTRAWNESAFQILIELMGLEASQGLVHFEQRSVVPGPGSREIRLMLAASISVETLKGWTADALVRAHLGRRVDSGYADLLVRHFTKVGEPSREVQRDAATTLLWPELVRAFELAPKDPRWSGLPAYWRERLQSVTQSGSTSPQ